MLALFLFFVFTLLALYIVFVENESEPIYKDFFKSLFTLLLFCSIGLISYFFHHIFIDTFNSIFYKNGNIKGVFEIELIDEGRGGDEYKIVDENIYISTIFIAWESMKSYEQPTLHNKYYIRYLPKSKRLLQIFPISEKGDIIYPEDNLYYHFFGDKLPQNIDEFE